MFSKTLLFALLSLSVAAFAAKNDGYLRVIEATPIYHGASYNSAVEAQAAKGEVYPLLSDKLNHGFYKIEYSGHSSFIQAGAVLRLKVDGTPVPTLVPGKSVTPEAEGDDEEEGDDKEGAPKTTPTVKPTLKPTLRPTPKAMKEGEKKEDEELDTKPTPTVKPTAKAEREHEEGGEEGDDHEQEGEGEHGEKTPTRAPTRIPTLKATLEPTEEPTELPTAVPTRVPTRIPTAVPTELPTEEPTELPTALPTRVPTRIPTAVPTEEPTELPTALPTRVPTQVPTRFPTAVPTEEPTELPTRVPTRIPTAVPTQEPTEAPTERPTAIPTRIHTALPTAYPTRVPTAYPTRIPTAYPTQVPWPTPVPTPAGPVRARGRRAQAAVVPVTTTRTPPRSSRVEAGSTLNFSSRMFSALRVERPAGKLNDVEFYLPIGWGKHETLVQPPFKQNPGLGDQRPIEFGGFVGLGLEFRQAPWLRWDLDWQAHSHRTKAADLNIPATSVQLPGGPPSVLFDESEVYYRMNTHALRLGVKGSLPMGRVEPWIGATLGAYLWSAELSDLNRAITYGEDNGVAWGGTLGTGVDFHGDFSNGMGWTITPFVEWGAPVVNPQFKDVAGLGVDWKDSFGTPVAIPARMGIQFGIGF